MDVSSAGDRWAVVLASRAIKELRKLQRDQNALDIAWKKIRELSAGQFTEDNHIPITGTSTKVPIYRARMSNDLRIIYHIDIVPDPSNEYDHQVIKILLIDARAHIDYGFWVKVSSNLNSFGSEYRERCVYRLPALRANNYVCLPAKFPRKTFEHRPLNAKEANIRDQVNAVLGLERYVPATKALYNSIVANMELNLPFVLDPYEREIVNHKSISIVVGRSGTGKTTALIYKMRAINQPETIGPRGTQPLRQLFVTRSRVLARHVESSYHSLLDSANIAHKTLKELAIMAAQSEKELDQSLVEFDNELDLREDLPPRFSLLDESHFPLFISFDKLCSLIEEDFYEKQEDPAEKKKQQDPWSVKHNRRRKFIGYNEFKEQYWPEFKSSSKFGLDPVLVYSEIMGVIKGSRFSEQTGSHTYLSQENYLDGLVRRVSSQLNPEMRRKIYSIFEQYRALKAARLEHDPADRTRRLLEFLSTNWENVPSAMEARKAKTGLPVEWPSWKPRMLVDYLYVDEVQDNLMADVHFLRKLCPNVEGTYWGGDTAQTIVAGSAFRIKDLGAYLYDEMEAVHGPQRSYFTSPFSKDYFELTVNFRSHEGIVRCAASVVQSLYKLFPDSLDHLDPETGKLPGPPPVVLSDASSDTSIFEHFLLDSSSNTGFGAQQAILVRSDAVARKLSSKLSELCPVLKITDSKGLEFDDILLYNFFATSEIPDAWDFVHESPSSAYRSKCQSTPPPSLCNELKLLYVAMTRARKRCWIWDYGGVSDAMKEFWLSRGLITTASTSELTWASTTSTSSQWVEKGQEYFANGMYKLAANCFKRGGRHSKARIATAYHQMSEAKLEMLRQDSPNSRAKLRGVAGELGECAREAEEPTSRHLWFHAASCLELAREILEAANAFEQGQFYERAIRLLLDWAHIDKHIDEGVEKLLAHETKLEIEIWRELREWSRKYYLQNRKYRTLLLELFEDLDDLLNYAKNGYREQYKELLDLHKRYDELADTQLEDHMTLQGFECLLKAFHQHQRAASLDRAAKVLVDLAEWVFVLEAKTPQSSVGWLKALFNQIWPHTQLLEPQRYKELNLFRTLLNGPVNLNMAKEWDQADPEEKLRKALIIHLVLQDTTWLNSRFLADSTRPLEAWNVYNSIISKVAATSEPSRNPAAQRLLGFKAMGSGGYIASSVIVSDASLVCEGAKKYKVATERNSGDLQVPARWVDRIVKEEFRKRLHDQLRDVYSRLNRSGLIAPHPFKPQMIPHKSSQPVKHPRTSDSGFQTRLTATATAIRAFAPVCHVPEGKSQRTSLLNLWVRRLFDVLNPANGAFEEMIFTTPNPSRSVFRRIWKCIRQYLLPPSSPARLSLSVFFSTLVIGHSLITHLEPEDLYSCIAKESRFQPRSNIHTNSQSETAIEEELSMRNQLVSFFNKGDVKGLTTASDLLKTILRLPGVLPDAAVMVHFIELTTCEMIFHDRAYYSSTSDGFSGITLPFSWLRLMAKQHRKSQIVRDTSSFEALLGCIMMLSDRLKLNDNDSWMVGEERLSGRSDVAHILNLRLCWCIALMLINARPNSAMGFVDVFLDALVHCAVNWRNLYPEPLYSRFDAVTDRTSCLEVLCQTLHHETLILMLNERKIPFQLQMRPEVLTLPYAEPGEIEDLLQGFLQR